MSIVQPLMKKLLLPFRIKPAFLIIGAQKSGTSALHYYLSQHPGLVPAKVKEVDFFSGDVSCADGGDSYHNNFPLRGLRYRIGFETSPSYLHNPDAAQRIYQYNSQLKLIAVLRDPVQRAFSAWKMYAHYFSIDRDWYIKWMRRRNGVGWDKGGIVFRSAATIGDFGAYVEQELDSLTSGKTIEAPILSHGFYYGQIERFVSRFGRGRLLLLTSHELLLETRGALLKVETFLDIPAYDWSKADLAPVFVGVTEDAGAFEDTFCLLMEYYRQDIELLKCQYNISL